jgi:hypothetical protein
LRWISDRRAADNANAIAARAELDAKIWPQFLWQFGICLIESCPADSAIAILLVDF